MTINLVFWFLGFATGVGVCSFLMSNWWKWWLENDQT